MFIALFYVLVDEGDDSKYYSYNQKKKSRYPQSINKKLSFPQFYTIPGHKKKIICSKKN